MNDQRKALGFAVAARPTTATMPLVLMFDLTTAAVIYCTLVAIVFLGLWLSNDHRDHRTFEQERRKTTFHCIRCDQLYTEVVGTELARCPRCEYENTRLKF